MIRDKIHDLIHSITWDGSVFFTMLYNKTASVWVLGDIDAIKRQLASWMFDSKVQL